MELLNESSHTRLRDATSSEDIDGIVGNVVGAARGIRFEQGDRPSEEFRLLCIGHLVHLKGDRLEPGLTGFCDGNPAISQSAYVDGNEASPETPKAKKGLRRAEYSHLCQLLSDDRLRDKGLSKDNALISPFQALLYDGAHPADDSACHGPALVVEIAHE